MINLTSLANRGTVAAVEQSDCGTIFAFGDLEAMMRVSAESPRPTLVPWWAVLVVGLLAAVTCRQIAGAGIAPTSDQQQLLDPRVAGQYSLFEAGISSEFIVRAVQSVAGYEPYRTNALVRAIAGAIYLTAGGLLAWSLTGRARFALFLLLVGLLFTSRFALLWLSTEVFAGAWLMLFIWSVHQQHPLPVSALPLACFGLSKPDLVLPAALMVAVLAWIHRRSPRRVLAMAGAAAAMVGLLAAATWLIQPAPQRALLSGSQRAWFSVCQHYAVLVSRHQAAPGPDPWIACEFYLQPVFGQTSTLAEVLSANPLAYGDFLFLAMSASLQTLFGSVAGAAVVAAVAYWRDLWREQRTLALLSLALLSNLIPVMLLSFVHLRYGAKFYPIVVLVMAAALQRPAATRAAAIRRYLALCLFCLQLLACIPVLLNGHWSPD